MLDLPGRFAEVVAPYVKANSFTHFYAACGFLGHETPEFECSGGPAERRIFDLASLTKALCTAPLIFRELAEGLALETSLEKWLGLRASLFAPQYRSLTIGALLGHTSGVPAWVNFWISEAGSSNHASLSLSRLAFLYKLNAAARFCGTPGKYCYSDVGYILLGLCLEEKFQASLSELYQSFCTKYLGLDGDFPSFSNPNLDGARVVPTSFCRLRRRWLVGTVHDENADAMRGVAGHAGLFGSGQQVRSMLRALQRSPTGKRFWIENATRLPRSEPGLLGLQRGILKDDGSFFGEQTCFGHLGFTGTAFFVNPKVDAFCILLTNRVISGRNSSWMMPFRRTCLSLMEQPLRSR